MVTDIAARGAQIGAYALVKGEGRESIVMAMGKIKRLVQDRGFGFITADDGTLVERDTTP